MRKTARSGKKILPGLWQLNQTTFVVRAQPTDPRTGKKRNRKRVLENATLEDAVRERERLLRFEDRNQASSTRPETVDAFARWWLEHKRDRGDLGPNAQERYATALGRLSKRILESLLEDVTPQMIETWTVRSTQPVKGRKPERYHPATINGWLRVLRALFNDACRLRNLPRNPALAVRPLALPVDLEEKNALAPQQLARLLEQLRNDDRCVAMAAWVQAFTGLRWGEVSALKWSDLDEVERVLRVQRTSVKGTLVPITKTKRARRVGIPELLLEELRAHREWLEREEHPGLEGGLMFPSSVGRPIWSARISEALRTACKALELDRRFTSHGFRRSLNDLLREAAVDPVISKAITGHGTDRMREHYSTVRDAEVRAAGDKAAALVERRLRVISGGLSVRKESSEESPETADAKQAGEASASNRR